MASSGIPISLKGPGASELAKVSAQLKAVGAKDLRKEMLRGIRNAAKPLVQDVKAAAESTLPHGGGLNRYVASAGIAPRTRTSGPQVGVRLVGTKGSHDLDAIDRGQVRHRVFGRGWAKKTEAVTPGFWSKTIPAHDDEIRRQIVAVLDDVMRRLS